MLSNSESAEVDQRRENSKLKENKGLLNWILLEEEFNRYPT